MKLKLFLSLLLAAPAVVSAQRPIRYEVSFPNYVHHEAQIKMYLPQIKGVAHLRMSRSSPGRYATHEFGKNVYDVKAFDSASGKEVKVIQKEGDEYDIPFSGSVLVVEYTLFGDHVDGTYAGIDRQHAHLNMPASFMWSIGQEKLPVEIRFSVPQGTGWKIATQLKPGREAGLFSAPDLQYFMDSPTELSDFRERSWEVKDTDGKTKTISVVLHGEVTDALMDQYTEEVKKIVDQAGKVYGQLPAFDYGRYTFLIDLMPNNGGDGMEHRNSTVITGRAGTLTWNVLRARLGTVAHEFFHCWNVERIRPRTLEPFDFSKANMSDELWVAEGFTQYYGGLLLARAGIQSDSNFIRTLGFYWNGLTNLPGAKYRTPVQASRLAVYVDAATAIDKTNFSNLFYSYYSYGAAIAGVLDLTLRRDYQKTLDQFMQLMWKKYGSTGKPYSVPDLQVTLAELTNEKFAGQFFSTYVYGTGRPSLESVVEPVGLTIDNPNAGKASLGALTIKVTDGKAAVTSAVQKGSPLYAAGVETGDVLISLDGAAITGQEQLEAALSAKKPGETVVLEFNSRGIDQKVTVKTEEATGLVLKFVDNPSDMQRTRQASWLGRK